MQKRKFKKEKNKKYLFSNTGWKLNAGLATLKTGKKHFHGFLTAILTTDLDFLCFLIECQNMSWNLEGSNFGLRIGWVSLSYCLYSIVSGNQPDLFPWVK